MNYIKLEKKNKILTECSLIVSSKIMVAFLSGRIGRRKNPMYDTYMGLFFFSLFFTLGKATIVFEEAIREHHHIKRDHILKLYIRIMLAQTSFISLETVKAVMLLEFLFTQCIYILIAKVELCVIQKPHA